MRAASLGVGQKQLQAAESLVSHRSSLVVLAAMTPQQPDELLRAFVIAARRRDMQLTLMFADLDGAFAFLDDAAHEDIARGRLRLVSLAGSIAPGWSRETDYLPYSLWDIDRMVADASLHVDVVAARVHRSEQPGWFGYGDMVGYTASPLGTAAAAVLEVAEAPPATAGAAAPLIPARRAEIVLESGAAPKARAAVRLGPEHDAIGRYVAGLLPDEATLQLGLGSVAEAVARKLDGKRNLGVHSGTLTPSLSRLIASGVLNGQAKAEDRGIAVATGAFGVTAEGSPQWPGSVELRPISHTHDARVLARHHLLWAVNSALEVDLRGQVNAEFARGRRVASGGGQTDFVRAAHLSQGGASVIALPSRTSRGETRIVARLPSAHPPTSAGQDVDFIVTEHGAAALRGLTSRDRAEAIIAVAHPESRDLLRRQLQEADSASASRSEPVPAGMLATSSP